MMFFTFVPFVPRSWVEYCILAKIIPNRLSFLVQKPIKQKLLDLFLMQSIFEVLYFMAAVLCFFFMAHTRNWCSPVVSHKKMTYLRSTPALFAPIFEPR